MGLSPAIFETGSIWRARGVEGTQGLEAPSTVGCVSGGGVLEVLRQVSRTILFPTRRGGGASHRRARDIGFVAWGPCPRDGAQLWSSAADCFFVLFRVRLLRISFLRRLFVFGLGWILLHYFFLSNTWFGKIFLWTKCWRIL